MRQPYFANKVDSLLRFWFEKNRVGNSYIIKRSNNKHIVLCLASLQYDFIVDFLKEFYGHRSNQVPFFLVKVCET